MDETKRNEIGATVFAILLGLSVMFFTGWLFTAGGCSDQTANHEIITDQATGPKTESNGGPAGNKTTELATLRAKLDAAKIDINEEAARRAELAAEKLELEARLKAAGESAGLEGKVKALQAEVDALKGTQVKLDGAMKANTGLEGKLSALTATLGSARKVESDLQVELKGLTGKLDTATQAEADLKAKVTVLNRKVDAAAKAEADLNKKLVTMSDKAGVADRATIEAGKLRARITDLEKKLNDAGKAKLAMSASVGESAKKLQADLEALKAKLAADAKAAAAKLKDAEKKLADSAAAMSAKSDDVGKKLQAQLDALTKKATADGKAWKEAKTRLAATNGDLQKQIEALKKQLVEKGRAMSAVPSGALASAGEGLPELDLPLLVNDPAELDPGFKDLFVNLRGIEDSPAAREKAYKEISGGGKYEPSLRIPFGSGSDFVSGADNKRIEVLVKEAGQDAKFLVVGYASTDGSNETNYTLSSKRASNVGRKLAESLGSEKNVQAVYYGQTARFSEQKSPNRIVEIWRVK